MHLSETILQVSKGIVGDVCHYHLGAPRIEEELEPVERPSNSCSDEVRTSAGSQINMLVILQIIAVESKY